jgi:hypothetical protein
MLHNRAFSSQKSFTTMCSGHPAEQCHPFPQLLHLEPSFRQKRFDANSKRKPKLSIVRLSQRRTPLSLHYLSNWSQFHKPDFFFDTGGVSK